jgi:hypothetical protein
MSDVDQRGLESPTADGEPGSFDAGHDVGATGEQPSERLDRPDGKGAGDGPQMEVNGELIELRFANLQTWVHEYLLALYRRPLSGNGTTWCPEWWRHEEAIVRLDALWRSWEFMRLDPATGIANWLRDCDYHMEVLLSADGPFRGCKPEQHSSRPLKALPGTPPPPGFNVEPAVEAAG